MAEYKIILTAKQAEDRSKWLEFRKEGIGGSDAAAIVGLSKWKSPYQLWLEKTGQVEAEDISDKKVVYWGTQLEDMVAKEFCKQTGKKVKKQGLYRSKETPFALASVDRMIIGEQAGLECKTTSAYGIKDWEGDNIPDAYYVQCQHYMMVTGLPKWYIAVLIGGNHFVWKEVPRNEEDIAELRTAEASFWQMVLTNTPPALDGSDTTTKALSEKFQGGLEKTELDTETEEALRRLAEIDEIAKDLEKKANTLKNRIKNFMGNYEIGIGNNCRVSWKTVAGRKSVDGKLLEKEMPDIYKKYLKEGKPSRRFTYEFKEAE